MKVDFTYFFVVLFAVPFFATVPAWYIGLETVLTIFLLIMAGVAIFTQSLFIVRIDNVKTLTDELSLPPVKPFFSMSALFGWAVAAVIIGSLYYQGMFILFTFYIIGVVINNLLRYTLIVKRRDRLSI